MLYEIGDPRRYLLPDVTCDFTEVRLEQLGEHRVRVHRRARAWRPGRTTRCPRPTWTAFAAPRSSPSSGMDAARKAQRTGEAILERTRELFAQRGLADYSRTHIEVLGSEPATTARTRGRQTCAKRCCSWP